MVPVISSETAVVNVASWVKLNAWSRIDKASRIPPSARRAIISTASVS